MKFLIDECLSPKLALMAREYGHSGSSHVTWEGLGGVQDWNLIPFVIAGDWTLVTKNSYDFRGPAAAPGTSGHYQDLPIHAGLICLNGDDMDGLMQRALFSAVLDALQEDGDLINRALEAHMLDTGEIVIERYDIPDETGI